MTTKHRQTYQERLEAFANSRIFHQIDVGVFIPANGHRCDCCGSAAPKTLVHLEDIEGNRYLVGYDCYRNLPIAFGEWPEVKRLGRAFELWSSQNRKNDYEAPWQLLERYNQQNSEDKAR